MEKKTIKTVSVAGTEKRVMKQMLPRKLPDLKELTPRIISDTITEIQKAIRENYVFPEQVEDICRSLEDHHANHEYDHISDPKAFCEQLTRHLRDVVDDKHMRVMLQGDMPDLSSRLVKKPGGKNKTAHFDLTKVEILPGNIGYVNINLFSPLFVMRDRLEGAMQFVKNTDALIFDVRKCRGGSGDSANFLLSYFFDSKTPMTLMEAYFRPQNRTIQIQTMKTPFKYTKPVYVLTSSSTGSCGEHFAFALKIHKRATLVGTNTAGMAHPVAIVGLDTGIMFQVPIGRTYDPKTKEDWEGAGITPDIRCVEDNALNKAQKEIQNSLMNVATDKKQK